MFIHRSILCFLRFQLLIFSKKCNVSILKPFVTKIKMAFVDRRRSLKRRICNMQNNEGSIYDEDRNFLDVFDE